MGRKDCNDVSSGFPADQDGNPLEFGVFEGLEVPLLVAGSVLQEIMREPLLEETLNHIEADPFGEEDGPLKNVQMSASGGIPIEEVLVEDVNSSDEECPITPEEEAWMAKHTPNPAVRAAFAINKSEREELFATRHRMQEMEKFLAFKGFLVADFERAHMAESDNFNNGLGNLERIVCGRDEFGLPLFANKVDVGASGSNTRNTNIDGQVAIEPKRVDGSPNRIVSNVVGGKDSLSRTRGTTGAFADNVFVDMSSSVYVPFETQCPVCTSGVKDDTGNVKEKDNGEAVVTNPTELPKTTWSQVVKKPPPPCNNLSFDYVPMPAGVKIVSPPDEVLRKGNEKFKSCIVGTFTRGAPPFSKVAAFAHNVWDKRGLVHISQKDSRTFVFKFDSLSNMNSVLAKGTWYLGSSPMLVHAWGSKVGEKNSMPLWVKFENMPDSYWTRDGLSFHASVIGHPLSADDMTSKLEILPFAKLCVEYTIGDDLPTKIEVEVLDPVTEIKHIEEVKVSYPIKPLVCKACKSLGHVIGACPIATRQWVQKDKPQSMGNESTGTPMQNNLSVAPEHTFQAQEPPVVVAERKETVVVQGDPLTDGLIKEDISGSKSKKGEDDWTTIQSHKSKLNAATEFVSMQAKDPTASTAPNLPIYSALAKSINKGKQKKARRSGGVRSPSH
ncbi:hypothetical protein POM88_035825 [Heracleum sosnowskyi]|uniref:DUF4283 domain-containing protein n=1 Tax=Heracleum sosnowskyi TaxID=360622 RepID=A0AAD8HNY9_9APIA|nr:hypothetical protein POM88_035825 [Heracleum sosnowskyi]